MQWTILSSYMGILRTAVAVRGALVPQSQGGRKGPESDPLRWSRLWKS